MTEIRLDQIPRYLSLTGFTFFPSQFLLSFKLRPHGKTCSSMLFPVPFLIYLFQEPSSSRSFLGSRSGLLGVHQIPWISTMETFGTNRDVEERDEPGMGQNVPRGFLLRREAGLIESFRSCNTVNHGLLSCLLTSYHFLISDQDLEVSCVNIQLIMHETWGNTNN